MLLLLKVYAQFNASPTNVRVDMMKEGMRLATRDIIWGPTSAVDPIPAEETVSDST